MLANIVLLIKLKESPICRQTRVKGSMFVSKVGVVHPTNNCLALPLGVRRQNANLLDSEIWKN